MAWGADVVGSAAPKVGLTPGLQASGVVGRGQLDETPRCGVPRHAACAGARRFAAVFWREVVIEH